MIYFDDNYIDDEKLIEYYNIMVGELSSYDEVDEEYV